MASNNTASIAQARKLVEQLKMEANIDRIKVAWWCPLLSGCQNCCPVVGAGTRWRAVFVEDAQRTIPTVVGEGSGRCSLEASPGALPGGGKERLS